MRCTPVQLKKQTNAHVDLSVSDASLVRSEVVSLYVYVLPRKEFVIGSSRLKKDFGSETPICSDQSVAHHLDDQSLSRVDAKFLIDSLQVIQDGIATNIKVRGYQIC